MIAKVLTVRNEIYIEAEPDMVSIWNESNIVLKRVHTTSNRTNSIKVAIKVALREVMWDRGFKEFEALSFLMQILFTTYSINVYKSTSSGLYRFSVSYSDPKTHELICNTSMFGNSDLWATVANAVAYVMTGVDS